MRKVYMLFGLIVGWSGKALRAGAKETDLEGDAVDDMQGVDDIAQGFGHFAAMSITHHGVQVHLLEGHLPCSHHAECQV